MRHAIEYFFESCVTEYSTYFYYIFLLLFIRSALRVARPAPYFEGLLRWTPDSAARSARLLRAAGGGGEETTLAAHLAEGEAERVRAASFATEVSFIFHYRV